MNTPITFTHVLVVAAVILGYWLLSTVYFDHELLYRMSAYLSTVHA